MISIIRAGYNPEQSSGSRNIDALDEDTFKEPIRSIKRIIIIKKIDPEEFEDGEDAMSEKEDETMSKEELDAAEADLPPEVENMSMEELGLEADDFSDLDDEEYSDSEGDNMTEEELKALEKEIPPEVDQMSDEEAGQDPDLDDDDGEGGTEEATPDGEVASDAEVSEDEPIDDKKEKKPKKDDDLEDGDLEESAGLNDYI